MPVMSTSTNACEVVNPVLIEALRLRKSIRESKVDRFEEKDNS